MHHTLANTDGGCFLRCTTRWQILMEDVFCDAPRRWRIPMDGGFYQCGWQSDDEGNRRRTFFINVDGNPQMEATAEGRWDNHSPRLASLPGVRAERINLPPKSGCINHGKYFSKLSQRPAIGSGVPPAREMGRMRRIPARIRFAPRTGLRKSAVAPRRCMWRWHFYNRSSAVFPLSMLIRRRCAYSERGRS